MSARLLKKFLKEQEQQQQLHNPRVEEDEVYGDDGDRLLGGGHSSDSPNRSSINPFDLLNDADSDHEIEHLQGNDRDTNDLSFVDKHEESATKNSVDVVSKTNNKSRKKKKKRGKEGSSSTTKNNVEKPLDTVLESLSLNVDPSTSNQEHGLAKYEKTSKGKDCGKQNEASILQVEPKYLNAENELRRIFGSKVLKSFERSQQAGSSRQIRGGRRVNHHIRKSILVTPSEYWHRWDGSLLMEYLETKDGQHYFRYVQSESYVQAQKAFEAAKATHDLNGIQVILMLHPYHFESLLTMADYFKFAGDHEMSADAIAKSLYGLECAWHSMFTPFQGNCQLKFTHETNKPLFTALFTHMKNLNRRGCHRSALEVCKLLLSLDSDDPMGAIFYIDYLALRAEEYAWLERFTEEYESDNSLWLFPNFSYSLSICRFYLELEGSSKNGAIDSKKSTSTDLMKQALMLHPSVLKNLAAKVPLKEQEWLHILKHTVFRSDQTGIPTLDHLINLYTERNYILWKIPELQKLLKSTAELVIKNLTINANDAKDWACVRKEAFSSDKNEYAHLLVSDFSDFVPSAPPEALQDFIVDQRMGEMQNVDHHANLPNPQQAPRTVADRNLWAVLFESMLPWVHYEGGDEGANEDQQNGPYMDDDDNQ